MEKIVEQGLLYDFYGELLTPHQQRIYEDAVFNDLSLSEIAQEAGISRQGVHDLIKRCDRTLEEYENRLHLMRRFGQIRQKLERIRELCDDKEVRRLTEEILQEL
ncbi:MAG TPA: YlxM family DNA-binding protein [Candidatus Eisenbergiella intestinipullorum]|nr:YlxM family DNA-binding protein [Candidatus Eisenbergiella intestinipullorum]